MLIQFIPHFNSIKVRLERNPTLYNVDYLKFQFHKGTIRTLKHLTKLAIKSYFNSIKVRLEPMSISYLMSMRKFQFHKGTIRT